MSATLELGFRSLFEALVEHDGPAYERILGPHTEAARRGLGEMVRFRSLATAPPISQAQTQAMFELSEWYALSRVLDYLLLSFSPVHEGRQWRHASGEIVRGAFDVVSASEYRQFATDIGLAAIDPIEFSPICCEIVEVIEDASVGDRIVLEDELWPGLRFGELIVARGGAVVRAAPHVLAKPDAETSTLYATYWRSHRPTEDRSRGWGSNSQWKTIFRRDYLTDTARHYNVDGDVVIEDAGDERIALLTHRCVVVGDDRNVNDRWVYDAMYVERI